MPGSTRRTRFLLGAASILAEIEERARVRLHQAANRMEDADPIEVHAAETVVRALNVLDRATGFRARHRAERWSTSRNDE